MLQQRLYNVLKQKTPSNFEADQNSSGFREGKKEERRKRKTPICIIVDLDKNERTILTEGNASVS